MKSNKRKEKPSQQLVQVIGLMKVHVVVDQDLGRLAQAGRKRYGGGVEPRLIDAEFLQGVDALFLQVWASRGYHWSVP